jgi:ABC-type oligopeptide transport system substrate-binding subunit
MSDQIMTASGQIYSKKVSLLSQQGVNATQGSKVKIKLKKKNGKKKL